MSNIIDFAAEKRKRQPITQESAMKIFMGVMSEGIDPNNPFIDLLTGPIVAGEQLRKELDDE